MLNSFVAKIDVLIFAGFFVPVLLLIFFMYLTTVLLFSSNHISNMHIVPLTSDIPKQSKQLMNFSNKTDLSFDDIILANRIFNIEAKDVMVYLHIQKTGGTTFGKHLVHDLVLKSKCACSVNTKRCHCFRPNTRESWLFSRYSTGWKCGLHADWTELKECVSDFYVTNYKTEQKWQYFYVTILREPIRRFLSEYMHVQRGATWKTAEHKCNGKVPTEEELPPCYMGDTWDVGSVHEFLDCTSNLAINRQTRMLADLHLIGCYNQTMVANKTRDIIMLESAKQNLKSMAFFGLVEEQQKTQYMFEKVFQLKFNKPFIQYDDTDTNSAKILPILLDSELKRVQSMNSLDLELYSFAKKLFYERYNLLKKYDFNLKKIPYLIN